MVVQRSPALSRRKVIVFGGQGSSSLFSSAAISCAENDARSSVSGAVFLSRCHAVFLAECRSLDTCTKAVVGLHPSQFTGLGDFLKPPSQFHQNGVIQTTTICLYQLLHCLAKLEHHSLSLDSPADQVLETTGFCSGLIAAAVVASSNSSSEFLDFGVEAFRLAFWIGCRAVVESKKHGQPDLEAPWSLVVLGLDQAEVEEHRRKFSTQVTKLFQKELLNVLNNDICQNQARSLRISAVSSTKVVSLSGLTLELAAFQRHLESVSMTRFAHVHAWYHGGEQLESVAESIDRDVHERSIGFPTFSDLKRPIRSTADGILLDVHRVGGTSFAQWVTRHLLIYPVDWIKTSLGISKATHQSLESHSEVRIEVISFGPSSESLLDGIKSHSSHPMVEFSDFSSFRAPEQQRESEVQQSGIAIVGMGIEFPKSNGQKGLWKTLSEGLCAVQDVPESRFNITSYYSDDDDDVRKPRKMPVRHGSFLDDVWGFDNTFFNISPREALSMDPQQRILLRMTQVALEDAGYVGDATPSFQKASFGCYIGVATGDYTDNLRNQIDVFYSPGTLRAFHSGKISFVHKLSGPSIVTDTACSSSLVSIYQAFRALQNGDCTAAIAGGVNVICSPDMYLGLARGHFLSPTGTCKPFDVAADGYGRAEGCGIFVLKRLADAKAENDRIYGIIKGVEVNQSGNSHSITHPHSETQAELFSKILGRTGIDPSSVSVVEAHGTGTQAGDTREMASIQKVFAKSHSLTNPLVVSSVKGNIGHCEAASGAAGLAKLLLMLRNREIPHQAGLKQLNSGLGDLGNAGIVVPLRSRKWDKPSMQPRRALLNNFGAAGSNASLLLEEMLEIEEGDRDLDDRSAYIFNLSAKGKDSLKTSISQHLQFFEQISPRLPLRNVCYTATARRQTYSHRISVTCASLNDLRTKLENADVTMLKPAERSQGMVFVFSGQGSLYPGMGKELMDTSPLFKELILKCDNIIQDLGFSSILDFLRGNSKPVSQPPQLDDGIITSQCACVSLEYALAKLMISWNIVPELTIGHSLGEYAALAISGAMTLESTLHVVANRARLMMANCPSNVSGMAACQLSPSKAEGMLLQEERFSQLSVACRNSYDDCVVAGTLEQLTVFEEVCASLKIKSKRLDVPYAFHSSSMDPIVQPLNELCRSIHCSPPTLPVLSNVFERLFGKEDLTSDYFALHARQPVRFTEGVQSLRDTGAFDGAVCIEIGPHPITLPMLRSILRTTSCTYLHTLQKNRSPWASISETLGQLFLTQDKINWRQVFDGERIRMIDLPGHPLATTSYTIPFQEASQFIPESQDTSSSYTKTKFNLLPRLLNSQPSTPGRTSSFQTTLAILGPLIAGHNVGGTAICPASVFHELVLEAAQTVMPPREHCALVVCNMSFSSPLIYESDAGATLVHVNLTRGDVDGSAQVRITVNPMKEAEGTLCCTASVATKDIQELSLNSLKDAAIVKRQSHYLLNENNSLNLFQTKLLYEMIFPRVVRYSREYQTLTKLGVSDSNLEGIGWFELPADTRTETSVFPPIFIDTLLHAAGFIANLGVPSDQVCICGRVESVHILDRDIDHRDTFTVYCSLVDVVRGMILADSYALNSAGKTVATIRGMEFKRLRLSTFQNLLHCSNPLSKAGQSSPEERIEVTQIETPATVDTNDCVTPPDAENPRDNIKGKLVRIVSDLYGPSEQGLTYSEPLDALGIDSMMQIEIASKIKRTFPGENLDHSKLLRCNTLQDLEDTLFQILDSSIKGENIGTTNAQNAIKSVKNQMTWPDTVSTGRDGSLQSPETKDLSANPVVLHDPHSMEAPLCLMHDGSGHVSMYARICDPDRRIFAFYDPDIDRETIQVSSLERMAERYVSLLYASEVSSLIIGGWSFGGVVAFEMARRLSDRGFQVKGLILIDSPCPGNHEPLPEKVIAHIVQSATSKTKASYSHSTESLIAEFQRNAALLASYSPISFNAEQRMKIKTIFLRSQETFDTQTTCNIRYDWLSSQEARDAAFDSWKRLVGPNTETLLIPGHHFEPFSLENITQTSAQIKHACQHIERNSHSHYNPSHVCKERGEMV